MKRLLYRIFDIRYWLIAIFMLVPIYAYCADAPAEVEKAKPKPGIKNIKPQEPNFPEEYKELEKAYRHYWDLFIKNDYEKSYKMESADYRKKNPFDESKYKKILPSNMKLKTVKPLEPKKTNDKEVMVSGYYYYSVGVMKSVKPFMDKWVKEENAWMHVPTEDVFKH